VSDAPVEHVSAPAEPPLRPSRSLSVGFLAMLPLLCAYEIAVASTPDASRNTSELLLGLALRPLGEDATRGRWVLLGAGALIAFLVAKWRRVNVLAGVSRVVLEGLLAACVLGPLMVIGVHACSDLVTAFPVAASSSAPGPTLADSALAFGAGAWEELAFRVGLYSFVYWLAMRLAGSFGASEVGARLAGDVVGLSLSSLAFAAAHFEGVLAFLGKGGRPFDPALFAWFTLGGALLGLLFRWRGPGVAAWTHGLYNVALWVGIDPSVIW
jgi:hypothetical protein